MFPIGWIAGKLVGRVAAKAVQPLSWLLGIGGAALLAFGAWQLVKHTIISQDRAEQRAETAERQLERTTSADRVDTGLEARDEARDDAVKGAIDDAKRSDPKGGSGAVGPVSNAAVDELRRSRANGGQPPR